MVASPIRRLGTRVLTLLLMYVFSCAPLTVAHAQETFPAHRTRPDLQLQIDRLRSEESAVQGLMLQNARRLAEGAHELVSRSADGLLGPVFGREREYIQLAH